MHSISADIRLSLCVLVGGFLFLVLLFPLVRFYLYLHRPVIPADQLGQLRAGMSVSESRQF